MGHLCSLLLLLLAGGLVFSSFAPVRAAPSGCFGTEAKIPALDMFGSFLAVILRGPNGELETSTDWSEIDTYQDPAGDARDRSGNPAASPDALCAIVLKLIEPDAPAVQSLAFVNRTDFEVVLPEEPGARLADAPELIVVGVQFTEPFPGSAPGIVQFGLSFDSALHPNYTGPALELQGRDTTFDAYLDDGKWKLGRTEYRDGRFTFAADYNEIVAIVGTDRVTMAFPEAAVPDGVETVGFFAVLGDGVEVVDLGVFDPLSLTWVARSGAVPTPASTPPASTPTATPGATPTAPDATPTATPGATPTASASASPSPAGAAAPTANADGGPPVLPLLVGGLLLAGVVAGVLMAWSRQSQAPSATSAAQTAAEIIAADVARMPLLDRPWKGTEP